MAFPETISNIFRGPVNINMLPIREQMGTLSENDWLLDSLRIKYPEPRLYSDEDLELFRDPNNRYRTNSELSAEIDKNYDWEFDKLGDKLFPDDRASHNLKKIVLSFFDFLAENHYSINHISNPEPQRHDLIFNHFACITESQGMGAKFDKVNMNLRNSLIVLASSSPHELNDYLSEYFRHTVINGRTDLDISLRVDDAYNNPNYILKNWSVFRSKNNRLRFQLQQDGQFISGENFELNLVESKNGKKTFEGWRILKEKVSDGTEVVIFQAGLFSFDNSDFREENLQIVDHNFSVELSTHGFERGYSKDTNSRSGMAATFPDRFMGLYLTKTSEKDKSIKVVIPNFGFEITRYGRKKWPILVGKHLFRQKKLIVEVISRACKQMSTKVGVFDIYDYIALDAEKNINDSLWDQVEQTNWSGYLVNNLISAVHLSPLVFGMNLIPNSRLNALSQDTGEGSLRKKLAEHGNDYSLSFGQLWPDVFSNLTNEQIQRFLEVLPHQKDYIDDYLADLDRYEQTGNIDDLKLEHQGVYYVMEALKTAGVEFPDFGGNYLMQFLYLFRHPQDMEIENIKVAMHDMPDQVNKLHSVQMEEEYAGD